MQTYIHIQRLDAGNHATNNNYSTAWLVIARSLDEEMLAPDVTLGVMKPNSVQGISTQVLTLKMTTGVSAS